MISNCFAIFLPSPHFDAVCHPRRFIGITTLTMIAYVAFTMKVTSRRTEYRKDMNRAETKAAGVMVDSLTNAEAVR